MPKLLVLYSTRGGHTRVIVDRMVDILRHAFECDVKDVEQERDIDLSHYQAALIGGPIYYGYFHRELRNFAEQHSARLNAMPSAFFGINLIARKPEKRTTATNSYVRKFLEKTPWKPKQVGIFAGALYYPRYGWFDRVMIQLIMKMTGGETDPTKEIVYTEWIDVEEFARNFIKLAKESAAPSP